MWILTIYVMLMYIVLCSNILILLHVDIIMTNMRISQIHTFVHIKYAYVNEYVVQKCNNIYIF